MTLLSFMYIYFFCISRMQNYDLLADFDKTLHVSGHGMNFLGAVITKSRETSLNG